MKSAEYRIPESAAVRDTKAFHFAADVVNGKIISGKRRIQACGRFLRELERSYTEADYPWRFDAELGYRPIRFIERFMVPTKGDYTAMVLLPWQHFIEANLYGWVSRKTGYRRFREALILVGQGRGARAGGLLTGQLQGPGQNRIRRVRGADQGQQSAVQAPAHHTGRHLF